jgi:hypothetical protein
VPVALCGSFLTLRRKKINQAFESKRLKRESGAIREEVVCGWNTWRKEELHDVCFVPNITGISDHGE